MNLDGARTSPNGLPFASAILTFAELIPLRRRGHQADTDAEAGGVLLSFRTLAQVPESVDGLDLGSSVLSGVRVRLPP